jgi:16S rRNA (cytosine1402-N4)-methyltransferase
MNAKTASGALSYGGLRCSVTSEALDRRVPMPARDDSVHVPVLGGEVLEAFGHQQGGEGGGLVVDATVGAGGHASILLGRFGGMELLGLDQDPEILELARTRLAPFGSRARLEQGRFSDLTGLVRRLHLPSPVAVLMDLGASSLQLDQAERGFSFSHDGPLDMRMDPSRDRTAEAIVNGWDEEDLADLFFYEGGERKARVIAKAMVEARRRAPFRRTGDLAELVERAVGGRSGRIHPATRTFQALRRALNEEGEELRAGLKGAECLLADGGLLVVISFHSGEDGEVKRFLQEGTRAGRWKLVTRKPVRPGRAEERANPRARSARLRAALRTRCPDEVRTVPPAPTLGEEDRPGDEGGPGGS